MPAMTNEEMRDKSGSVNSASRLTAFLYLLMRDHLPVGKVEEIVMGAESCEMPCVYTNGWLASYAQFLNERLKDDPILDLTDIK
jgi:hypothetical protein